MSNYISTLDRARLRWRARRGMLENDLIITRFLDAYETELSEQDVSSLTKLFEMDDNKLLNVLLGSENLTGEYDDPNIRRLVERMKAL